MVTAVETAPGTDPDRASFITAMEAAKDQLAVLAQAHPGDQVLEPVPVRCSAPGQAQVGIDHLDGRSLFNLLCERGQVIPV